MDPTPPPTVPLPDPILACPHRLRWSRSDAWRRLSAGVSASTPTTGAPAGFVVPPAAVVPVRLWYGNDEGRVSLRDSTAADGIALGRAPVPGFAHAPCTELVCGIAAARGTEGVAEAIGGAVKVVELDACHDRGVDALLLHQA